MQYDQTFNRRESPYLLKKKLPPPPPPPPTHHSTFITGKKMKNTPAMFKDIEILVHIFAIFFLS